MTSNSQPPAAGPASAAQGDGKPQSPELAGGAGFTFEDAVAAFYLTALLGEGYAPGVDGLIVCRVATQQRNFNLPLDDVIVDFRNSVGAVARLSLQVKRSLTISAAAKNEDFRDIVRDAWSTYADPAFRQGVDRFGVAVGQVAAAKSRDLTRLCEIARASGTVGQFNARFGPGGNASEGVTEIKEAFATLLQAARGSPSTDVELHGFLSHFVLVHFDFLHEGAHAAPQALTRLRDCLAEGHAEQAPLVWAKLRTIARDSAGKAGDLDRKRLVHELARVVRLRAAPSLRGDLEKIAALSHQYVADIQHDIGGAHVERRALAAKLDEVLRDTRFVQISGLPGSGKSVLLRRRVLEDLETGGPVLFLKSGRLSGKSWAEFATANGISATSLPELLTEIGAVGSRRLYIDGIDRVESEHQPVVLDVLRAILSSADFGEWRIVVSLRDTGLEPLRNWLSALLMGVSIGTVDVKALDKIEAEALATAKPALHPLLFGPPEVREIVRRPFFAKVLFQSFSAETTPPFEPTTEVDLIEHWWARGGYDAMGQEAITRQRALIDLATHRARELDKPLLLAKLAPATVNVLNRMLTDGVLQFVKSGISVRFSHDIFFEWAFFFVLTERGSEWPAELRACGEPPAVARVVELLSQSEYRHGRSWSDALSSVSRASMRPQWTRAWLLGPIASPVFEQSEAVFRGTVSANDFALLRKALVWFQAEKTVPNPMILARNELPGDKRIRIADSLAWPSDLSAWRRLIGFVLDHVDTIPASLYPDAIAVFEVWQNLGRDIENPVSAAILAQAAAWLGEIDADEERLDSGAPFAPSRWSGVSNYRDTRQALVNLILGAARVKPEWAKAYIERLHSAERISDERFGEVIQFAPILSGTHPQLLVDLTLKHLQDELPDARVERQGKEEEEDAEARRAVLAKPESERTRKDQMLLQGGFVHTGELFTYHDWDHLAIDRDARNFWPPSPLREPFHSLFRSSPSHALQLLRGLCNHAIEAWRQLHRHIYDSPGTPVALEIEFPWGRQKFWGGFLQYLWYRRAPEPITCGFMALQDWAFSAIDGEGSVDDVIRQVVQGNSCIGILAIASLLALDRDRVSESVYPLVTSQRLIDADWDRMTQELDDAKASLIGFKPHEQQHFDAVKALSARPARKKTLWSLAGLYVVDGTFRGRARTAILSFADNLPFQMEEHREVEEAREYLAKQAREYAELADIENYRVRPAKEEGKVEILHVSPSASSPENLTKVAEATRTAQVGQLWMWAADAFEKGNVDDETFRKSIQVARSTLDGLTLFEGGKVDGIGMGPGAVAATAALVLHYPNKCTDDELHWARDVVRRATKHKDEPDTFAQAMIPWHPGIFAARGLSADVHHGTANAEVRRLLLELVAHPLEVVSLTALGEATGLWDKDPKLAWAAITIALTLCHVEPGQPAQPRGPHDRLHSDDRVNRVVTEAYDHYERGEGWAALPRPPVAWVQVPDRGTRRKPQRPVDPLPGEEVVVLQGKNVDSSTATKAGHSWGEPIVQWYSRYAAEILVRLPLAKIYQSASRASLVEFVNDVLTWTIAKNAPPWADDARRDHDSSHHFEWTRELGNFLGRLAGLLPAEEVRSRVLAPIFQLKGDNCWALLNPLVSTFICTHVFDAEKVPVGAVDLLGLCVERFIQQRAFDRESYRAGELTGFHAPDLAKALMFVEYEAAGSARFANGDWTELPLVLPIVDRYVRAAGWSPGVMDHFLTLCERSKATYPAEVFADQILAVIGDGSAPLPGWHGTLLCARVAGLIQVFADRDNPMRPAVAQKLLRVLDALVDLGDRRSAALQLSEAFRQVRFDRASA